MDAIDRRIHLTLKRLDTLLLRVAGERHTLQQLYEQRRATRRASGPPKRPPGVMPAGAVCRWCRRKQGGGRPLVVRRRRLTVAAEVLAKEPAWVREAIKPGGLIG